MSARNRAKLEVHDHRLAPLAAFLEPWGSNHRWWSTIPCPTNRHWDIDASVEAVGVESHWAHGAVTISPSLRAISPSLRLPVNIGTSSPRPNVLC
jgi:hypothetical protein